jgi:hypothetical protein
MLKQVCTPYMLIGGSLFLGYQLIIDYIRHHDEGNRDRPEFFDHQIALTLIGAVSLGIWKGLPKWWFIGGFVGGMIVSPVSWWVKKHGRFNG